MAGVCESSKPAVLGGAALAPQPPGWPQHLPGASEGSEGVASKGRLFGRERDLVSASIPFYLGIRGKAAHPLPA